MKLKEFLDREKLSARYFAKLIGCDCQSIYKYIKKGTMPRLDILKNIIQATQGQVTAEDFDIHKTCPKCRAKYIDI